jgi:hypothetical protein
MDSNAHHPGLFGGKQRMDKRGELIEAHLDHTEADLLNTRTDPTFVNSRGHETHIDITFATKGLAQYIHNWRVTEDETGSDHKLIQMELSIDNYVIERRLDTRNVDWEVFKTDIEADTNSWKIPEKLNINMVYEHAIKATEICETNLAKQATEKDVVIRPYWKRYWNKDLALRRK